MLAPWVDGTFVVSLVHAPIDGTFVVSFVHLLIVCIFVFALSQPQFFFTFGSKFVVSIPAFWQFVHMKFNCTL